MENTGTDEMERFKTKFMSAWHNVKYSWALKTKTTFSRNSPVFLLGKCYHFKSEEQDGRSADGSSSSSSPEEDLVMGNVEAFRRDFASRLWLTYREEFPPLPGSSLTSDCGWGCMLRAGQMMLAQALVLHFLGRDWRWSEALTLQPLDTETRTTSAAKRLVASLEASLQGERPLAPKPRLQAPGGAEEADVHLREVYHRTLVSWFGDVPQAQLGLHRLVRLGLELGKRAGDWYGPAVVAHILRKAVEEATDPGLTGITAYVAQDCTVYSADVLDSHRVPGPQQGLTGEAPPLPPSRAVIILIPVRLGGEKTNPDYFNFVKGILSLEYCIGIIGGKPKQACCFVGFQDDSLIYMDPHYCQCSVDVSRGRFPVQGRDWSNQLKAISPQSFHCPSPKKMSFSKMDPSCTLGFYSRSIHDYERISQEVAKVLKPSARERYPAFTFMPGHRSDYDPSAAVTVETREWPFIRDTKKATPTVGDFVLL